MNGKPLDEPPTATGFTLSQLPRGAYVLSAKIKDTQSQEFQDSDSVTFYVQQPSLLTAPAQVVAGPQGPGGQLGR